MKNNQIYEILVDTLSKSLNIAKHEIQLSSKLRDDLGADSLDSLELIMELEEEFKVTFPEEIIGKIKTVKELSETIEGLSHG